MTIQFYLEFVRDALAAAHSATNKAIADGTAGGSLGRGTFGDTTYEIDQAAEKAVLKLVKDRLPSSNVISEESGIKEGSSKKLYVLLDPVDGSTNAKRDVSLYSTSIAVADGPSFKDIFAAGVLDHVSGRLIWGWREAVYEGWAKAIPSTLKNLKDALLAFDSKMYRLPKEASGSVLALMESTKYPRMISTAALETAYVASGRLEAFIAPFAKLRSFDCLPSIYLVLAAGGVVEVFGGDLKAIPLDGSERLNYIAAGNATLLKAIKKKLRNQFKDGKDAHP